MISSGTEAVDRKQRIRDRYKGVDTSELEVIPAKTVEGLGESTFIRRVAAYVRVSTDNDEQTSSYELQKNYYTDYLKAQPGGEFVGIYDDEGISGTSLEHRKGMQQLIEDCKAGKIDLILTKSIARFARNIVDCLSVIETLKNLDPPVGVKFEADNIYTLDSNGRMILTILASVAEEESHSKSIIMNWSIDRRFSRGLFLTPALLGYDQDEDGNLVVNPEEAQTVKVIYYLYLNGFSFTEIAELLTEYGRKTKLGNTEWNPGTLAGVIANERHCGDVLARKTFTPNFLTHKSKKNNNDRTQYRQRDHHEAIVSREVYNAANHLRASRSYAKKNRPLPVLSVVDDGILRGYVPFDKDWTGFSAEEYREASESVMREKQHDTVEVMNRLDLTGYEVVRAQYFATLQNPAMTISNGKLRFNTACLKKFEDVEYVELLLNSVDRCIAIRPCEKSNPNAIRWGRLKEGRWCASTLGCRGLAKALFDIMEWDDGLKYRFRGQFVEQDDDKLMLFELDEPEMNKVEEIVLPPKEEAEGETVKQTIYVFPPEWAGTFGQPITSVAQVGILQQEHYSGNWDVLRPAAENDRDARAEELESTFSYDGYQVVRKELFAHLRDPAIVIRKDSITFNTACITGLEDVVYVHVMFNSDLKRLVVRGCDENDKDALRWCIAKPDKRKSRKMTCKPFAELVYKEMGWDSECLYKMLGYRISFEGETLYVFDLLVPEIFHEGPKRKKETSQNNAQETKPADTRKGFYPDDIAGTFGVPVEEHLKETEIKQIDGYVSMGILTGKTVPDTGID